MTPDRIAWHLWNWNRWISRSTSPGRLPAHASGGIECYQSWDIEGEYEEADRVAGAAVQAALDGMAQRLRLAVYVEHGIMAAVFRLRDHVDAYADACMELGRLLPRRGLC